MFCKALALYVSLGLRGLVLLAEHNVLFHNHQNRIDMYDEKDEEEIENAIRMHKYAACYLENNDARTFHNETRR